MLHEFAGDLVQELDADVGAILEPEVEAAGLTDALDRRGPKGKGNRVGRREDGRAGCPDRGLDGIRPFLPGRNDHDECRVVRLVRAYEKRSPAEGDDALYMREVSHRRFELDQHLFCSRQFRAVGKLDVHEEDTLILVREEARRQCRQ